MLAGWFAHSVVAAAVQHSINGLLATFLLGEMLVGWQVYAAAPGGCVAAHSLVAGAAVQLFTIGLLLGDMVADLAGAAAAAAGG